jgi:hypothetical protein
MTLRRASHLLREVVRFDSPFCSGAGATGAEPVVAFDAEVVHFGAASGIGVGSEPTVTFDVEVVHFGAASGIGVGSEPMVTFDVEVVHFGAASGIGVGSEPMVTFDVEVVHFGAASGIGVSSEPMVTFDVEVVHFGAASGIGVSSEPMVTFDVEVVHFGLRYRATVRLLILSSLAISRADHLRAARLWTVCWIDIFRTLDMPQRWPTYRGSAGAGFVQESGAL